MVVDFAKVSVKNAPVLILQNLDDIPIGVLGNAFNIDADLCYNEISTLTFDLPAFVDGLETSNYDRVVGMRIVDLKDYGRFLLLNPKVSDNGVKQLKSCTAYSLEYEFTFKKMVLTAGTYNFWNPLAPKDTLLGIILNLMPSWKIGNVDASLIDKYRTFDDSGDQNIYNFMKSDLQKSYGCIFYFDTYNRVVHVRDIMAEAPTAPVYFSLDNLVKKISIDEDTESIVTCLSVSGADGVDIRSVNPMGTNYIIDLGYFMTLHNFSQEMIDKYYAWKSTFEAYQQQYYNLTIEEALRTAQLITEQAALTTLQGELTSLENIQAVTIQAIAQKLKVQDDLDAINEQILSKNIEITSKKNELISIQDEVDELYSQMSEINNKTHIKSFFTEAEYMVISRYLKEDSVAEDSFVIATADTYDNAGESIKLNGSIFNIINSAITKIENQFSKDIYSSVGGNITCSTTGFVLDAEIIKASMDFDTDKNFLFTARLNSGTLNGISFPCACISISGTATSVTSNVVPNAETNGAYSEGDILSFKLGTANLYFTRSITEYEKRSVEWDLFDFGQNLLKKVAYPAYSCSLDIANFLALEDFEPFKNKLELGNKLYWKQRNGDVLRPLLIRVRIPFEDLSRFEVAISSKYNSSDPEFYYEDLIESGVSAGKTLDTNRWMYSQFVNSGAETSLGKFMKSALDIAKNSIISSTGQAITWDEAGFRLRKRKEGVNAGYEPYQIWMNNSSIMFTTDNWSTANLAIGQMVSEDGNMLSGVIADALIGKIVASNSLIIESEKTDGGVAVFRVDGDGASLHNATFDIYNSNNTHITLNPYSGIAIGEYPVYDGDDYTIDEDKAKFWVDTDGNVHLKGTLHGVDGTFSGELKAATGTFSGELAAAKGTFSGIVQAEDYIDLNGNSMMTSEYKFEPDYLELKGLNINNNFIIDSGGNVTMRGNITMTGGNISWDSVNESESTAYRTANSASIMANSAINNVARLANGQYSGTFINGTTIVSPTILTNLLEITAPKNNLESGLVLKGYYNNAEYQWLKIWYYEGDMPVLHFTSPDHADAYWNFGRTVCNGYFDFTNATVIGLDATFA